MEYSEKLRIGLIKIKSIEEKRTLLNGHFTKIAKESDVKVKDLKELYKKGHIIIRETK